MRFALASRRKLVFSQEWRGCTPRKEDSLLPELRMTELPRWAAWPLTCREETDVPMEKRRVEVGVLLVT